MLSSESLSLYQKIATTATTVHLYLKLHQLRSLMRLLVNLELKTIKNHPEKLQNRMGRSLGHYKEVVNLLLSLPWCQILTGTSVHLSQETNFPLDLTAI